MNNNKLSLLKNLTLLLVEDDMDLLNQYNSILSLFFAKVFIAHNGVEALKIHSNNKIDMMITDYVMPFMNGYELSKTIRYTDKIIPIVIMSSYTEKDKLLKSITLGLVDYLVKPFDYNILMTTLSSMVEKLEIDNGLIIHISPAIKYNSFKKELVDLNASSKIKLTKNEIALLDLFIKNPKQVISYDLIELTLWPEDIKGNEVIKNVIYRLRKKLGKNSIVNVQDIGYVLQSNNTINGL